MKEMSILIVDDMPGMTKTLSAILTMDGYQVSTAHSGEEAVAICKNQTFDVILMDVRMPDMNGVEAFRAIRNHAENTRCIMMSAFSVEDLKREALNEGAVGFLQKPLDLETVVQLIEETQHPPILLVVDDQEECDKINQHLDDKNYRVHTTTSGEDALELARQIKFSVIIIDTRLPDTTGLDLYLAIKEITPTSVTIMLAETEPTFTDQAKEAVRHSAYTFLHKPLDVDILLELLARIQKHNVSGLYEKPESKS